MFARNCKEYNFFRKATSLYGNETNIEKNVSFSCGVKFWGSSQQRHLVPLVVVKRNGYDQLRDGLLIADDGGWSPCKSRDDQRLPKRRGMIARDRRQVHWWRHLIDERWLPIWQRWKTVALMKTPDRGSMAWEPVMKSGSDGQKRYEPCMWCDLFFIFIFWNLFSTLSIGV